MSQFKRKVKKRIKMVKRRRQMIKRGQKKSDFEGGSIFTLKKYTSMFFK
jgi:hypothetical protein